MFNYIPLTSRASESWYNIHNCPFGHGDNSSYSAGEVGNIFQDHRYIPMRSTCSIVFHRHPSIQNQVGTSPMDGSECGSLLLRFKSLDTGQPERGVSILPPPGHISKTGWPNRIKFDVWTWKNIYIPFIILPGWSFEHKNVYYIHQRV